MAHHSGIKRNKLRKHDKMPIHPSLNYSHHYAYIELGHNPYT